MKERLAVLVLAGGGSERFGQEKAFFEIGGKPMVQHVVMEASKLSDEIVISCRSGREKLTEMFPWAKVIEDKCDRKGALTGLMSTLPEVRSEYVALVTCDCPKVKSEIVDLLFQRAKKHDGAVPVWPNGNIEPLQAVYKTERLRKAVSDVWKDEKMRLAEVLRILPNIVFVSTEELRKVDPKLESFLNVNSPEDIEVISKNKFIN